MRSVSLLWAALIVTIGVTHAASAVAREAPPQALPHIIFIMADDLGYGDPGCYNPDSRIPTPNLDRLATEGVRFTDAHTPSAVCTPTRYGVLTGRYCWRTRLQKGVLYGESPALIEPGRMTVASLLKQHGYATACIGKWHLGLGNVKPTDYGKPLRPGPVTVGFDTFFGIPASLDMAPYLYIQDDRPTAAATLEVETKREGRGLFWRPGPIAPGFKHIDVLPKITEQAVAFIQKQTQKAPEQPLFLYFPLTAPHTPWVPTQPFKGKSQAGDYGDFVTHVDSVVGEVMHALDKQGFAENTLIIVTSDNGSHWPVDDIRRWKHAANLHYRGQKADIWEGGHRVPFVARWPGHIPPGTVSDQTVCLTDLLATAAAIVDTKLPADAGEDSVNILPALLGEPLNKQLQ